MAKTRRLKPHDDSDPALPVVRASIMAGALRFASAALQPAWVA